MTAARRGGAAGYRWDKFTQLVFATYGNTCWICGHGGLGARQVDHVQSITEHPELAWVLSNCRPAHGSPRNKCRTCHQFCNQLKGGYSLERARRLIAERSGQPQQPVQPPPDQGRAW
jgi:5-methylcytosine-specific restriction endonuclease McrA